jgi:hypothetical protein
MNFRALLEDWQSRGRVEYTATEYAVRLPIDDAARVHALAEMFPGVSREQIVTDLLHMALAELAEAMPYVPGENIIREDEYGDPVYEDAGPTPRFMALTRKYKTELAGGGEAG